MEKAIARVKKIKQGNPLDPTTMIGAQASNDQLEKILSYIDIGKRRGREGADRRQAQPISAASSQRASTSSRPCSRATTRCASSRRRSSDRCSPSRSSRTRTKRSRSPTTRSTASAPACGRATATRAYRLGRGIQAGRVWTNCYHLYPAHAAFGGYKQSGIGRETHKMMLDHYQQTKNMLVSYSPKALGFFYINQAGEGGGALPSRSRYAPQCIRRRANRFTAFSSAVEIPLELPGRAHRPPANAIKCTSVSSSKTVTLSLSLVVGH